MSTTVGSSVNSQPTQKVREMEATCKSVTPIQITCLEQVNEVFPKSIDMDTAGTFIWVTPTIFAYFSFFTDRHMRLEDYIFKDEIIELTALLPFKNVQESSPTM